MEKKSQKNNNDQLSEIASIKRYCDDKFDVLLEKTNASILSLKTAIEDLVENTKMTSVGEVKKNKLPNRTEQYAEYHIELEIDERLILWEVQSGIFMGCNPLAMFRYMLGNPKYDNFKHIWVIESDSERNMLSIEFLRHENVQFISPDGDAYLKTLCQAKYIVDNVSHVAFFSKKEGQIVVNTWHSTTVKTLGFDTPKGPQHSRNMLRSFMKCDYLISPNPFMTKIFSKSFKLNGVFEGEILETGFPRADTVINGPRDRFIERLTERGVHLEEDKKVVLYCPTWRGSSLGKVSTDIEQIIAFSTEFAKTFNTETHQLLIKPHPVTFKAMLAQKVDVSSFVPPQIDANELLSKVDLLITDYSSIFFDFLPTKKDVVFFIPDATKYESERGSVFTYSSLPGPVFTDQNMLFKHLKKEAPVSKKVKSNYDKMLQEYCLYDDGQASKRIVETIFTLNKPLNVKHVKLKSDKRKVLIHGGNFAMNGVTTSLLAMLENIDYNAYDVTLYLIYPTTPIQNKLISWIPKKVRVLLRFGGSALTIDEKDKAHVYFNNPTADAMLEDESFVNAFKREYHRCVGGAKFDVVIDYSGYSIFWSMIFKQSAGAKLIMWQHNQLSRDFTNTKKRNASTSAFPPPTIELMKDYYKEADAIISCSEPVFQLNRIDFGTLDTIEKFGYFTNLISTKRILNGMLNRYCFIESFTDAYTPKKRKGLNINLPSGKPRVMGYYADVSPSNRTGRLAKSTVIPLPNPKHTNFVTIGRYSTEKNHIALLEAFVAFSKNNAQSRLYIIGDGHCLNEYQAFLKKHDLEHRVHLTGVLKNPYGLASLCDCFILPSLYEGMGLVAVEARIMGLTTILSDFDAVPSVTFPDGQMIVGKSSDELHRGMCAFQAGEISKPSKYDDRGYHKRAALELSKILG